jgi:Chaperone of endosialidase
MNPVVSISVQARSAVKIKRSPLRPAFCALIAILSLAFFALPPKAQATDLGSVVPGNNTADGTGVLVNRTTGMNNSGIGYQALNHDTSGGSNTATGYQALFTNKTGAGNTAIGSNALHANTASFNTATGSNALSHNINGNANTAIGLNALSSNSTGDVNTAAGSQALIHNTDGSSNTAVGFGALFFNALGNGNTAIGDSALSSNTADSNTAVGFQALLSNTTGMRNTVAGYQALDHLTNGQRNIAIGYQAGSLVTSGNDIICIGAAGGNVDRSCFIGHIFGEPVNGFATPVAVDSNGKLGTPASSRRFKDDIKPMDKASEGILALKPVTFHYKSDTKNTPQFGLVAEEVAEVNPNLVVRDNNGEIYTVRYEAVNAMLLNEFLKEHRKVEKLEAIVTEQKSEFQKRLAEQQEQIEALTTGLAKVSEHVALRGKTPRLATTDF